MLFEEVICNDSAANQGQRYKNSQAIVQVTPHFPVRLFGNMEAQPTELVLAYVVWVGHVISELLCVGAKHPKHVFDLFHFSFPNFLANNAPKSHYDCEQDV